VGRLPQHNILFDAVQVGPKTLKNRFYQVPHSTGFGTQQPRSQAAFRAVRAEGGWAAICTENCSFGPDFDESPVVSARLWDESDLANLSLVPREAHRWGALAGIELGHAGAHSRNHESRMPPPAPSQLSSDTTWQVVPQAMTRSQIRDVQAGWARAGSLAVDGGFDIVYVYGGMSYLPMQFLSPFFNRRDDEYGGTFENRSRFWLETLEAVREAVDGRAALACRIGIDTINGAGVRLDEALRFIALADDLVDLWDVNLGGYSEWDLDSGASRFYRQGWQLERSSRVREASQKPIVGVGRLTDPDTMASIIRSGVWDLIGAARPAIADPFLPKKIEEGRIDAIRECIGCNMCVATAEVGQHIACTQNPTAGEEFRRAWHPERIPSTSRPDRTALVVGAGPAGLECAMVLAERGLASVHLVEARDHVGGSLAWVAKLPGFAEWERVISYRRTRIEQLPDLAVVTGRELTAEEIVDYGGDVVVLAVGARWAPDGQSAFSRGPIPGLEAVAARVLTPEDVMLSGRRPATPRVTVYDCEGYFMGVAMAELLAIEGFTVELVTPHERVAPLADETLEGNGSRRRLQELGVVCATGTTLTRIDGETMILEREDQPAETRTLATLILCTQRISNSALVNEVMKAAEEIPSDRRPDIFSIGDCTAPRTIADAVFDGHRLAREIDGADPSRPLPFARERVLVEPT
jgi:dimethylamine/trimethylamine dehydrogenase